MWCTCAKCRKHRGGGKSIGRTTWYSHNPGGKKGAHIAQREPTLLKGTPPVRGIALRKKTLILLIESSERLDRIQYD